MMDIHAQPDGFGGRAYDRAGRERENAPPAETVRSLVDDAADTLQISSDAAGVALLADYRAERARETRIEARKPFRPEESARHADAPAESSPKPEAEKMRQGFNPLRLSGAIVYRAPEGGSSGAPIADSGQTMDASQTGYFESAGGKVLNVVRGRILNVVS